uniref:Basal body orientation factor 1b n=1 Tax=Neolamprologus brichardi TaxID=32507 RepID=A0A3Q4GCF5_NEOBR
MRIIFGSVFPLLIFTGYSKAPEKKNPSGKEKGVYKEKEGKRDSKTDKESDVEKAKANAVLWELRLKATEQSLRDYTESCQKVARANEHLTNQLYHAEKDAIHIAGHWERHVSLLCCKLFRRLKDALHSVIKERDCLIDKLKYHIKEAEDLQKLAKLLTEENTSLALDKSMLELTVKDNAAQLGTQKQKLSELRAEVASLEEALQLQAVEIEQLEKKEKANLVTIQASQVELDKLQKVLAMREKEMKHVKQLASTIVAKRQELEEFFHEALGHVRKEIKDSRLQYKQEALQSYRRRFREATAGKIKFPPIRTFHKTAHSTNSVYSDMEAAATWTDQPGSEVEISDLTWEQKEQVLRLLFQKSCWTLCSLIDFIPILIHSNPFVIPQNELTLLRQLTLKNKVQ